MPTWAMYILKILKRQAKVCKNVFLKPLQSPYCHFESI